MSAPRKAALFVTAAFLLLAGCSGGDTGTRAAAPPRSPVATTTPPPSPPPKEGACYTLRLGHLTDAHDDSPPVKCRKKHTSQTFLVTTLPRKTVGDPESINTKEIAQAADQRCSRALHQHLGGDKEALNLSRLRSAWFVPDEEEFARGARWLRCDVVAYRTTNKLATLPRKTAHLLEPSDALDEWGTCAKASTRGLEAGEGQRMCAIPHNWRAIETRKLGKKSDRWPGAKSVREDVLDHCEEAVRSFTGNETETANVGWLPPTKKQWRSGQRYGVCWAKLE